MELVNTVVILKKLNGQEEELTKAVVTDENAIPYLAEMFGRGALQIGDELIITYQRNDNMRQITTVRRTSKYSIQTLVCTQTFQGVRWWG